MSSFRTTISRIFRPGQREGPRDRGWLYTDIGGALYAYSYDGVRQLLHQTNSRGQDITYQYDHAGRLSRIVRATNDGSGASGGSGPSGAAITQQTDYAYDLAGNRLLEQVRQGGVLYQDNRLAYDAQGRLRLITGLDGVRMQFAYDKAGNRTHQWGSYLSRALDGSSSLASYDHWYRYDSMNRQTLVDGVNDSVTKRRRRRREPPQHRPGPCAPVRPQRQPQQRHPLGHRGRAGQLRPVWRRVRPERRRLRRLRQRPATAASTPRRAATPAWCASSTATTHKTG